MGEVDGAGFGIGMVKYCFINDKAPSGGKTGSFKTPHKELVRKPSSRKTLQQVLSSGSAKNSLTNLLEETHTVRD